MLFNFYTMEKIKCDVCGSHKIVKQDDGFICKKCGTQYTLQQIRQQYKKLKAQAAAAAEAGDSPKQPVAPKQALKTTPVTPPAPSTPSPSVASKSSKTWVKWVVGAIVLVVLAITPMIVWFVYTMNSDNVVTLQNIDQHTAVRSSSSTQVTQATSYDDMDYQIKVPTNYELWEDFKLYFEEYYNVNRADQPIEKASVYLTYGCEIMTDPYSEYKWLGDYIQEVAASQGYELTNNPAVKGMEAKWRWHIHCFFNCTQNYDWPKTADFYYAGQRSQWADAYRRAYR